MIRFLLLILLASCSTQSQNSLKVAASAVPHAEMLEFIKPALEKQGIHLEILVTDDYQIPNQALAQHEVDANFFQHLPFLEEQIRQFHYPIESLAKIEIEPMGLYSQKLHNLADLSEKATIAIPNDPTNEGRALLLLQKQGLIQMKDPHNLLATVLDIRDNPHQLKFIEVDAAMLPRTLEDVDVAAINTNFALAAHLTPSKALAIESPDSPYVNIIAIRQDESHRPDLQALKKAMTSDEMRTFILKHYQGAVLPAF